MCKCIKVAFFLMFSRAREDLRLANQKINTILADYGDVVPRREYEMLEASYKVHTYYIIGTSTCMAS